MQRHGQDPSFDGGPPVAALYTRILAAYLALMYLLWILGLEGIYAHPTPFYALYAPATGAPMAVALTVLLLFTGYRLLSSAREPGDVLRGAFLPVSVALLAAGMALSAVYAPDATETVAARLSGLLPRLAWQLPALASFAGGAFFLVRFVLPRLSADHEITAGDVKRILWGVFAFSVLFACTIAMIRGGFEGIAQAYARSSYEYIGDIGKTRTIHDLFSRYLEIHEHLSMHAKVHPPGPIALLWIFSMFLLSTSPMTLSLATVVFSSLAIFPLYAWAKRIAGQHAALIACLCYVTIPSVVLFTATSADALFAPFTLSALYCFERAIRTRSTAFALLAGVAYGAMILLKFSLIGIGAYFGLVGLWMLRRPETRVNVVKTAALMLVATAGVLGAVYLWSGYNVYENFLVAKAQFDTDQYHLDELTPRLASWTYKILNPACWFYFAGIPMSVLFLREFLRGDAALRGQWVLFLLTLVALNFLYLARGEGERSALYMIPFVVIPAATYLAQGCARPGKNGPLVATLAFLAFQTWFTETFFYTYW